MTLSDEDPMGRVGKVILGTRGAAGPGEVSVAIRGGRESFIAYSDEPIPAGEDVLVIESMPGRAVFVVAWARGLVS